MERARKRERSGGRESTGEREREGRERESTSKQTRDILSLTYIMAFAASTLYHALRGSQKISCISCQGCCRWLETAVSFLF